MGVGQSFVFMTLISPILGQYYLRTIAGTGTGSSTGNNGPASSAALNAPYGIWGDNTGNLYVCEWTGNRVRKISPTGIISFFLGSSLSYSGNGGPATSVNIDGASGIFGANDNYIYINGVYYYSWRYNLNFNNVTRFAGAVPGAFGYSGDGGPATSAQIYSPKGIFVSSLGIVYIADYSNHRIRSVNGVTRIITTFAGTGTAGSSGDNGQATSATLKSPLGVWGNTAGVIFIADGDNNRVRRVDAAGIIRNFAGTGASTYNGDNIQATSAILFQPSDVKGDTMGTIYISELAGCRIRMVSTTGIITTLIGTGTCSAASTALQLANGATINNVRGIWVNTEGNVYFTEFNNHYLRYVYNGVPTALPTAAPTGPSEEPTMLPTLTPTAIPTVSPTRTPTTSPSRVPTFVPSRTPTRTPTETPTRIPTTEPSISPTTPTQAPTRPPTRMPSQTPTRLPTATPSRSPSRIPTCVPTRVPSIVPSTLPSMVPTFAPSVNPTELPSCIPSLEPSMSPSCDPTLSPSTDPTIIQSELSTAPTMVPSEIPTITPSGDPTTTPSEIPSVTPSSPPTMMPSEMPSVTPSIVPTTATSEIPSPTPSTPPTATPSEIPSISPSSLPTTVPSQAPSVTPSNAPTNSPSEVPSMTPSMLPTTIPSEMPTMSPSIMMTTTPSEMPSLEPSIVPTAIPSETPSLEPSMLPTTIPSEMPSVIPSIAPTTTPSAMPSLTPSMLPTTMPSEMPTMSPTSLPTIVPSEMPSMTPSMLPTTMPSEMPTLSPTSLPTTVPSEIPSLTPSMVPTIIPSDMPTMSPTSLPTTVPSEMPSVTPSMLPNLTPSRLPSIYPSTFPSVTPSCPATMLITLMPTLTVSSAPTFTSSGRPGVRPSSAPSMPVMHFSRHPTISSAPLVVSASSNTSNWKNVVCLFGIFSSNQDAMRLLDVSYASEGTALIIFGSKSLSLVHMINASIPSSASHYPITKISPSYKRDTTTRAAVIPGDLNGDRYNDLIVCYPLSSICYIFFGNGKSGLKNVEVGVTIYGLATTFFGFAVSGAEDVNQDGYMDVIICALRGRSCCVLYGRSVWAKEIRFAEMLSGGKITEAADGYKILADGTTSLTGLSVAGVGDMNGDGRPDLAVSVQKAASFIVYVMWGEGSERGRRDVVLAEVGNGVNGFMVFGEQGYYTGLSISRVGDVNEDGLADLVIGAIPLAGREMTQQQRSYLILGHSEMASDLVLGEDIGGKGIVALFGGGLIVSGPGDLNGDGIEDIMITEVNDYRTKGNAYIISYPKKMSSPPSFIPSSQPSSTPSTAPSSVPSSSSPSYSPSIASSPSEVTNRTGNSTLTPKPTPHFPPSPKPVRVTRSPSIRPSIRPTTFIPSILPTMTPTRVPTQLPTAIRPKTAKPTVASTRRTITSPPSFARIVQSPSPTSSSLLILPWSEYEVRSINASSANNRGIVQGKIMENEIYEISSMSRDGRSRSGWSGTIIGGKGRKIYRIYPKDPAQPVNRIILQDFDTNVDVIDLSHMSQITSKSDLTYLTHPLTLYLPDNQRIILSNYETLQQLKENNFLFAELEDSSNSNAYDLFTEIAFVLPIIVVVVVIRIATNYLSSREEGTAAMKLRIDDEDVDDFARRLEEQKPQEEENQSESESEESKVVGLTEEQENEKENVVINVEELIRNGGRSIEYDNVKPLLSSELTQRDEDGNERQSSLTSDDLGRIRRSPSLSVDTCNDSYITSESISILSSDFGDESDDLEKAVVRPASGAMMMNPMGGERIHSSVPSKTSSINSEQFEAMFGDLNER